MAERGRPRRARAGPGRDGPPQPGARPSVAGRERPDVAVPSDAGHRPRRAAGAGVLLDRGMARARPPHHGVLPRPARDGPDLRAERRRARLDAVLPARAPSPGATRRAEAVPRQRAVGRVGRTGRTAWLPARVRRCAQRRGLRLPEPDHGPRCPSDPAAGGCRGGCPRKRAPFRGGRRGARRSRRPCSKRSASRPSSRTARSGPARRCRRSPGTSSARRGGPPPASPCRPPRS